MASEAPPPERLPPEDAPWKGAGRFYPRISRSRWGAISVNRQLRWRRLRLATGYAPPPRGSNSRSATHHRPVPFRRSSSYYRHIKPRRTHQDFSFRGESCDLVALCLAGKTVSRSALNGDKQPIKHPHKTQQQRDHSGYRAQAFENILGSMFRHSLPQSVKRVGGFRPRRHILLTKLFPGSCLILSVISSRSSAPISSPVPSLALPSS